MRETIIRELKDRKWSLLAYCLGSLLMLWVYVATFTTSTASAQQLQELVKTYPKALLEAIGLGSFDLNTLEKYLNVKHFSLVWPLVAIILAISRAGSQIAGEIGSGTMGLSLSLPLSRARIFVSKYLAGLITILMFTAVSVFGVIPLAAAYNIPSHIGVLSTAWILCNLFMMAIYSLGLLVSAAVSERGKVYAIMSGGMLAMYMAFIVAAISSNLAWLKHYSLFYYFDTQHVLAGGHISWQSLTVFSLTILIASSLALWRFTRRDIYV